MEEPLGSHVGNALEVREAIDVLSGRVEGPLLSVSLLLGEQMLILSGIAGDEAAAREKLLGALKSGAGLHKLRQMISAQGGQGQVVEDVRLLPEARYRLPVAAARGGCLSRVDTTQVGLIAQALGAGRLTKEDVIDPAVGLVLHKRVGDRVETGETLAEIHANDREKGERAAGALLSALHIGQEQTPPARQLYAVIKDGRREVL